MKGDPHKPASGGETSPRLFGKTSRINIAPKWTGNGSRLFWHLQSATSRSDSSCPIGYWVKTVGELIANVFDNLKVGGHGGTDYLERISKLNFHREASKRGIPDEKVGMLRLCQAHHAGEDNALQRSLDPCGSH
jgi:hypothetical protein